MLIYRRLLAASSLLLSLNCWAQDYSVGNWSVIKSLPGIQIAKVNTGDSSTGLICILATSSCYAYVAMGSTCDDGAKYPLLVNAPTGSFPSTATCRHLGNFQIMEIDEFTAMISAFESGGEIGFVTPMANGQFKVVRFSTVGATAAIKDARSNPAPPPTDRSIKDKAVEFL